MRLITCWLFAASCAMGCNLSSSGASQASQDAGPITDAGSLDAARDVSSLDAGGPLTSPFLCGSSLSDYPNGLPLDEVRAAAGFDFLEARISQSSNKDDTPGSARSPGVGVACATASDKTACQTALAALPTTEGLFGDGSDISISMIVLVYLAYSKGDTVGKISNPTELRAIFPTVNGPPAAFLYTSAAGYTLECAGGWFRQESGGVVVKASKRVIPCHERDFVILFVPTDGNNITVRDQVADLNPPCL